MIEKTFKIVSNSAKHLTAELISEALLNYFTLDPTKADIAFGVVEQNNQNQKQKTKKIGLEV